jgi:hypothetical protein
VTHLVPLDGTRAEENGVSATPDYPARLWVHPYQLSYTGDEWHWAAEEHRSNIIKTAEYVRVDSPITEAQSWGYNGA